MNSMAKIALLGFLFVAALTSGLSLSSPLEKSFYISPDGNDGNTGTKSHPFATLERAVRAVEENQDSPMTIYLREGYYPLHHTIVLQDSDSTPDFPLVIRTYPGEQAHIIGGREITGFRKLKPGMPNYDKIPSEFRDRIMTIDLKARGILEFGQLSARGFGRAIQPSGLELYFNSKPMTLARWPNSGWATIAETPDSLHGEGFIYSGDRPSRWTDAPDVWLHGYWKWDWADSYVNVARIDTANKTIWTHEPHGCYPYTAGKRFYALNLLQELDSPGEWYLDRETGVLYFWPPSDIHKARAFVSMLKEPMISLQNTRNVTLQDLIFEVTCGAGVEIVGGRDNAIKDCILLNVGTVAVSIGKLIDNPGDYRRRAATADVAGRSSVVWKEIHVGEKKGVIN